MGWKANAPSFVSRGRKSISDSPQLRIIVQALRVNDAFFDNDVTIQPLLTPRYDGIGCLDAIVERLADQGHDLLLGFVAGKNPSKILVNRFNVVRIAFYR
jgi:hypothetical protein